MVYLFRIRCKIFVGFYKTHLYGRFSWSLAQAGLVIIDNKSSMVLLVHPTAREYLLANLEVCNFPIVMACCTFLSYAANHLSYHLRPCGEALPVACFVRFLHNRNSVSSYLQAKHVQKDNRRVFAFDQYPESRVRCALRLKRVTLKQHSICLTKEQVSSLLPIMRRQHYIW